MGNKVVHFEVIGNDAAKLQGFYGSMFDWKVDASNPMNYGIISPNDAGMGGGVGPAMGGGGGMVTFYVEVPDLAAALKKAEGLGGKKISDPMDVPGGPSIAQFADPEGNVIGLIKAGSMNPA